METIELDFGGISQFPVYVGRGENFYSSTVCSILEQQRPDHIFLIVDNFFSPDGIYNKQYFDQIAQTHAIFVPGGENCKTINYLCEAATKLLSLGCTKKSIIIGIGGGSVLNLAGLTAALMFRGIKLFYFPTTFLAQHDVIPSRKTAINMGGRKNNFGTYYSANGVFVDTDYVKSLNRLDFFSGIGELMKNTMILGGENRIIMEEFESAYKLDNLIIQDSNWIKKLVLTGIKAKKRLLKYDATELNQAVLFEYGHTVGHALEYSCNVPHGIAIMYGMLFCSYAAFNMGIIDENAKEYHDRVIMETIKLAGEKAVVKVVDSIEICQRAIGDNKRGIVACKDDEITCVLICDIGIPYSENNLFLVKVPLVFLSTWLNKNFICTNLFQSDEKRSELYARSNLEDTGAQNILEMKC